MLAYINDNDLDPVTDLEANAEAVCFFYEVYTVDACFN